MPKSNVETFITRDQYNSAKDHHQDVMYSIFTTTILPIIDVLIAGELNMLKIDISKGYMLINVQAIFSLIVYVKFHQKVHFKNTFL